VTGAGGLFSLTGCVIVAAIAGFPFILRASRASIAGVDPRLEQAARAMGLPEWRVALQVTLPQARRGIGVGLTLGGLRALGEYGATLMVGAAVAGRTLTMAIAVTDAQTLAQRNAILVVAIVVAALGLALVARLQQTRA
jgi:molybdate transport system permease protein